MSTFHEFERDRSELPQWTVSGYMRQLEDLQAIQAVHGQTLREYGIVRRALTNLNRYDGLRVSQAKNAARPVIYAQPFEEQPTHDGLPIHGAELGVAFKLPKPVYDWRSPLQDDIVYVPVAQSYDGLVFPTEFSPERSISEFTDQDAKIVYKAARQLDNRRPTELPHLTTDLTSIPDFSQPGFIDPSQSY